MAVNKVLLSSMIANITNCTNVPKNIDEIKQWIIAPLLSSLGYNVFSSDVIPNYNIAGTDCYIDFLVNSKSKPVMIVECIPYKSAITDVFLGRAAKHLFSGIRVVLITNGITIWVYSDAEKRGVLDSETQFEVNLANFKSQDYFKLNLISNEKIASFEPKKPVKHKKEINKVCESLVKGLKIRAIPNWVVDGIIKETGIPQEEIDKSYVIKAFARNLYEEFDGFRISDQMAAEKKTVVKKEPEYCNSGEYELDKIPNSIASDYDIEKIDVFGTEYNDHFVKYIYIDTLREIAKREIVPRNKILNKFSKWFISSNDKASIERTKHLTYIPELDVYVKTAFNALELIKRTRKLLEFVKQPCSEVKVTLTKRVF